jgi:glycosyltransferase involved in cell wall biosynthesis
VLKGLHIKIVGKTISKTIADQLLADRTGCIEMVGSVTHDRLMQIMASMDILLCSSIDDPMPIVCTEAMMLSKPVIVSSNTGTASFIVEEENGFVFHSGDAQALADAITRAVNSRNRLAQMGQKARLVFEQNFTNKIFEASVQKELLSLL